VNEFDFVDDPFVYPILTELLACLRSELGDQVEQMCYTGILLGTQVPADYAGMDTSIGAAYVRLQDGYPSVASFPEPDATPACDSKLAFTITLGILRCTTIGDEQGNPPDQDELDWLARVQLADFRIMRRAIQCCARTSLNEDHQIMLGSYTPLENQGGVAGGEFGLIVQEAI
jgi:hypothetical protein